MGSPVTAASTNKKVVFRLRIQAADDESLIRRLRLALKVLWRQFGLRVLEIEEEQTR
jgi:hypothetical protein